MNDYEIYDDIRLADVANGRETKCSNHLMRNTLLAVLSFSLLSIILFATIRKD